MANEIDLVVGEVAFQKITELIKRLGDVDIAFGEIATKFSNLGKGANPQSTAELAKLTAENEKLNKALTELRASYAAIDSGLAKTNVTRASSSKLITQETIDIRLQNKELAQTYTEMSKNADAYQKADAQFRQMTKSLKAMAFEGKEGTKDFIKLENELTALGNRLKSVDAMTGSHTRNVGNYASSWNGLGNSINQLTREAPAFANSVQTGFMALSNNIPILTDELSILIAKNKQLQADGKPTESILKTLAGAFFSWQTAISLGVTILTVYGAKIWDSITGAKAKEEALKKETKALEEKTKAEENDRDVIASKQADEISRSQLLLEKAKNLSLTYKERTEAVKELKDRYPDFLKSLSDEKILAGETADAEDRLNVALINRGFALAAQESIQENLKEELNLRLQFSKNSEKALQIRNKEALQSQEMIVYTDREDQAKQQKAENERNQILEQDKLYQVKLANLRSERQSLLDVFNANSKYLGIVKEVNKASSGKDKTEDVERKAIKSVNELQKVDTLLGRINTEIERLKVEKIVANAEELPAVNFQLEMLYKLRSQLNELPVGGALPDGFVKPEQIEGVKELTKEMQNYLNSFGAEFASKAGLSETFNMLSGNIEGFGENAAVTFVAVAESAQEMFNIIAEASQANFDQEYARLDKQKETSLKFAGDSTVAKEKIEADYEKKKKEIQLREFKAKQKMSVVNIAIDTAQAIIATIAATPLPAGLPLAIMVGAMGAIQAGIVLAQKPPAYAEGTDNHKGGLMLVNDGAGSNFQEKIILPSGKVIRPQGRNVLMDAPKGTKVLNHEQQLFEMLQSNNISMSSQQNQGMTPDEMDEILGKHFSNIKTQNTIFDKNGFQSYVKNGNSITRSNSNRSQAIGISV